MSNCDHKIITKTYARKLCDKVASKICENQTAYIKGRMINDNIRSMIATVNLANMEDVAEGVIVALDARKAFDSVSHSYIKKCLKYFGCERFIKVFEVLYKDLRTDIIVNGRIAQGFRVRRGVKQGDSLSCIVFIMCMEPLLRNIESNPDIDRIDSGTLNARIPKAFGYADDINLLTKANPKTLKAIFSEYERLSRQSGLVLNAEKTEIMRIGKSRGELHFRVRYLRNVYELRTVVSAKINGILFQNGEAAMVDENVNAAIQRADNHLKSWSRRSLSTLGKILICKTFAISQFIYLMQSITLKESHFKRINALLYKFIWNRHYAAAKAPEQLKREIVCQPLKQGGLGMLDMAKLDSAIKLKMLGRMFNSTHPFLSIIKERIKLDFFSPTCDTVIDRPTNQALKLLGIERAKLWNRRELDFDIALLTEIGKCRIRDLLSPNGLLSLNYFLVRQRGKLLISDLNRNEVTTMLRHINKDCHSKVLNAVNLNLPTHRRNIGKSVFIKGKFRDLDKCTSKCLRESLSDMNVITQFKVGLNLPPRVSQNWLYKISKLSSTKHKEIILKVAHGNVYTQERLARFGLEEDPTCPRCNEVEDLEHKIQSCGYVSRIWDRFLEAIGADPGLNRLELVMGVHSDINFLAINGELLKRILSLRRNQEYLIHPKVFVRMAIKNVLINEKDEPVKNALEELLSASQ